jgi:RiboL-PSP-HEPN
LPSSAFNKLQTRLADVDDLMNAHAAVGGTERGRRRGVEGINRAAVVMLCAHLEGYVEDLLGEAMKAVHPELDPGPLVSKFHNPWPDQIDALFAAIGLPKASRGISWQRAGTAAVIKNLEDLVRTRNKIAHGATEVDVSKRMVTRFRGYIEGFARELDLRVAIRIFRMTGNRNFPWGR